MRAVVCTKYGPPEVLVLKDIQKPAPKDNEVLIRIHATAVTVSDCRIRGMDAPFIYKIIIQMVLGFGKPRNPILGMVLSGVVENTGKSVTSFKEGDAVFAYGAISSIKLRFGSYAEYICLPEDWNVALKPASVTFDEAAAIPYGGLLAWHLMKKADIQRGQKVLVYGASGSVGTMAIQFAMNAGTSVTAVCSSKNFEMVESLGADKVIDYTRDDAVSKLEKYDLVLDAVGERKTSALKEKSKKSLTSQGKYISIDKGIPSTSRRDFLTIKKMVEEGKLKPIIDRSFPLEEMVQAHKYVERGHKRGNVVITIGQGA